LYKRAVTKTAVVAQLVNTNRKTITNYQTQLELNSCRNILGFESDGVNVLMNEPKSNSGNEWTLTGTKHIKTTETKNINGAYDSEISRINCSIT